MNFTEQNAKQLCEDIIAGLIDISIVLDVLLEKYTTEELEQILTMFEDLGYQYVIDLLIVEKYCRNIEKQKNIEFLEKCFEL